MIVSASPCCVQARSKSSATRTPATLEAVARRTPPNAPHADPIEFASAVGTAPREVQPRPSCTPHLIRLLPASISSSLATQRDLRGSEGNVASIGKRYDQRAVGGDIDHFRVVGRIARR